jgi:hypothetical protein
LATFFHGTSCALVMGKNGLSFILVIFSQTHLVTLTVASVPTYKLFSFKLAGLDSRSVLGTVSNVSKGLHSKTYQTGEWYAKWPQNIPNGYKM